jgi:nitrate/TMAO reductase-like tetraheme cytochrome c subunit
MRFFIERFARMTKGGIAGLIAVVMVAGLVLFVWGARALNTTPHQCVTCHPVLTAMWKRSQGHPADRVTCYECHAQHAELPDSPNVAGYIRDRLIPEKYFSFDERVEERCEGCHEVIREAETEQKKVIKVNHKIHLTTGKDLEGKLIAMACLDCHRNIAHDKAQIETYRPTMAGCFVGDCHRKDRNKDNCRRCHYQQLTEPGQEVDFCGRGQTAQRRVERGHGRREDGGDE